MSSRIRSDVEHIFECFCEVIHQKGAKEPNKHIVSIFPEEFTNDFLKFIPEFTFPCQMEFNAVQHFSFALTSIDSTWTYGFCRHEPFTQRALVIVSHFPYHDAFYELLDHVADLMRTSPEASAGSAKPAVHSSKTKRQCVPPSVAKYLFGFYTRPAPLPQPFKLPTLPDNINLTEYFCAVDFGCMVAVMASLLHERRIMMVSRKLSRLSACVQAANQLIYPLEWQGIYIPVLPNSLKDCLLAPMPYLIGVPYPVYETLVLHDIGDVVTIFLDTRTVTSPFDDVAAMPQEILEDLLAALESCKNLVGDAVARAFLQTLVHLLGGIESAIRFDTGPQPSFDKEAFVTSRGSGVQPFLREMLNFQMFQQFLEGRLALVAAKAGCSDEFARECCAWEENQKLRKRWKRKPAQILKNLKNKTQPAMDSAIKTVRSGNKGMKSAYKGLKNKLVVARRSLGGPSVPVGAAEWWERPGSSQDSSCSSEPTIVKVLPQTLDNETSPQDLISLAPGDDRSSLASHGIICMEDYAQEEEILIRQSEERFYERIPQSDKAFSPVVFSSPQKGQNPSQLIVPDIVCYFDSAYEPVSRPGPSWQQPEVCYSRRKTGTSLLEELLETTQRSSEVSSVANHSTTLRNKNCISSPTSTHSSHLLEDNLTNSGISDVPSKLPSNNVSSSTPIRKPYQPGSSIPAVQLPFRNAVSADLLPDDLFETHRSLPLPRSSQPYFSPASTPTHPPQALDSLRSSPISRPGVANTFQLPSPLSPHPAPPSPQQPASTVSPLVLAGLADNDGMTPIDRTQEDELLEQYGIDFQKFNISRKNWTKFE